MSLQDDHFDLEAYFKQQVKGTKKGTAERHRAESARAAYKRVWESFVDNENENEKCRPVINAVTTMVQHVIETHYMNPRGQQKR